MPGSRSWAAAGVVLVVGLGAAATAGRSAAGPAQRPVAGHLAVVDTAAVCSSVTGLPTSPTLMTVASVGALLNPPEKPVSITRSPLTGSAARTIVQAAPLSRLSVTTIGGAVVVRGHGAGAAGVVADQQRLIPGGPSRGLLSTPCLSPGTDTWITGTDGRIGYTDYLVIANPGTTVANLTVTGWSTRGPLQPPKLQSLAVDPGRASVLRVADYAPDAALVALHVHANSGRITAEVLDERVAGVQPAGIDWIPPTLPPATDLVVPGYQSGTGARLLVLANPGPVDATVALRVATTTGNFVPSGNPSIVVRAGQTTQVDLSSALGGAPAAVLLHSDAPVTATGMSQATAPVQGRVMAPDIQWQPAARPLPGPSVLPDNTPPFGQTIRIYLTAPRSVAHVMISTGDGAHRTVTVPAGRTLSYDPEAAFGPTSYGMLMLTPAGGGPVYASRTLFALGAHGPLVSSEEPTPLPGSIELPVAVEDFRAAIR